MTAAEIARRLAERIDLLAAELLPGGQREGRTWRCGSIAGEGGSSLCVELAGPKRGVWHDFADEAMRGDALDLVRRCRDCSPAEAIAWAGRWLGIAPGEGRYGSESTPRQRPRRDTVPCPADRPPTWPKVWSGARPIGGTIAQTYLAGRGLAFRKSLVRHDGIGVVGIEIVDADPDGDVLRFAPRRVRLKPGTEHEFEHHPALLALVRDVRSGKACGLHSIYLLPDGSDRIRDRKGKLSAGRIAGGAVMLEVFEDVAYSLTIAEGVETAIGVQMAGLSPVWALCGAGNLAAFPVLPEIQALTVAADTGAAGQAAAQEVAARWRKAGRDARIATPTVDDWAASRRAAQ